MTFVMICVLVCNETLKEFVIEMDKDNQHLLFKKKKEKCMVTDMTNSYASRINGTLPVWANW